MTIRFIALTSLLLGLSCGHIDALPPVPEGASRGELVIMVATMNDGTSRLEYFLRAGDDGADRQLIFEQAPEATPGATIDVWGAEDSQALRVARFEVVREPVGASQAELRTSAQKPAKRIAFVLVNVGGGVNLTAAQAMAKIVGPASMGTVPLNDYYIEASYGRQPITGQVFGPFNFTMTTCAYSQMAQTLRAMIPGTFDHYFWYLGSNFTACGWAGLGQLGTPTNPARDTWYNGTSGCVVMVQEPGHNFGMQHSSSLKCGTATFADLPGTCTHSEYGDRFDPMGNGCRHMNGFQKQYQGWFGGCNLVEVKSSGTFKLLPLELPCDGVQTLQIAMPKTRPITTSGGGTNPITDTMTSYYLELRTGRGLDQSIAPVVQVRVAGNPRASNVVGRHSWILDMNPATAPFDGLVAGGTFTDPIGGLTIQVTALSADEATISVQMAANGGAPTCAGGAPFQEPGPDLSSCLPEPARPQDGGALIFDAGFVDAGVVDAGRPDAGRTDAGVADAGRPVDAGSPVVDAGARPADGGIIEGGSGGGSGAGGGTASGTGGGSSGTGGGSIGAAVADPQIRSGCGCNASSGGVQALTMGALLLLRIRRRQGART